MESSTVAEEIDFKQSLLACYANIAIMEMKLYNNSTDDIRPSHKEILYLYSIWTIDGCTATDLVELFDSSKALVSQTILAMERKGYIVREKDPNDNRRQILRISPNRINSLNDEIRLIENAVKHLSHQYSEQDIEKAGKIIMSLTDIMANQAIRDANKR